MKSSMISESKLIDAFKHLFLNKLPISISGESGTGKTTLALFLIGNLLTSEVECNGSCVWIQASELFPIKRLDQIFKDYPEKLRYLKENILITPQSHIIHTYKAQGDIVRNIISPTTILPSDLRFIVIDNISHHLRYRITHFTNISDVTAFLDSFYENQLLPLMLFCRRSNIGLILIHEVTFDPKSSKLRSFFYKLYDRIKTIDIILSNKYNMHEKEITITTTEFTKNFSYTLEQSGISIN